MRTVVGLEVLAGFEPAVCVYAICSRVPSSTQAQDQYRLTRACAGEPVGVQGVEPRTSFVS